MFESCMKTFLRRVSVERVSDVTPELLREFFYEGTEKYQWGYWHYANHLKYLRKFFVWCVERGHLRADPTQGIRRPRKPKTLPRRLSFEEAQQLLYTSFNHSWRYEFERSRNHALIATMLFGGFRASEVLSLQMVDVNLPAGSILVREGKGGKDRYVPVHHKLSYILRRYLDDRRLAGRSSPYLFVSALRDEPISYKALGKMCRRLAKASGVRFTPHALRHTFGSVAVEQGMGLAQLREVMGHADISSTMIYVKMSPKTLRESVCALDLF